MDPPKARQTEPGAGAGFPGRGLRLTLSPLEDPEGEIVSIRKLETKSTRLGTENPPAFGCWRAEPVPARGVPWAEGRAPGDRGAGTATRRAPRRASQLRLLIIFTLKEKPEKQLGRVHSVNTFCSIIADVERAQKPIALPSALGPLAFIHLGTRPPITP